MSTIGYGDIIPCSTPEKIYVMISMIAACGVFAYIIGSIGSIVNRSDTIIAEFKYIIIISIDIFRDKIMYIN